MTVMSFDYLAAFPIPSHLLPSRLRSLLEPVGLSPQQFVEVASLHESASLDVGSECLHLLMAVVPGIEDKPIQVLSESGNGVVAYSVPVGDKRGCTAEFSPSISGYDYIVAAWGDGSFYTFNLAEKVWMTLGLTPRCIGNDLQRLIYDDLGLPEFGVAEGDVSSQYHWDLKKSVSWRMSNEYLRRYLWLREARGVRVFFYAVDLPDCREIRKIMDKKPHVVLKPNDGAMWYELDIREHNGRLLLQVWASVEAIKPELCPTQTADNITWPGGSEPMTHIRANALITSNHVFLNDRFLDRYEQNTFYDSTPYQAWGQWYCSPSYKGQWSFTDCKRVGRNLIHVPMRELYKPKPDREILHAFAYAVDPKSLAHLDLNEEHVVAKTQRLLDSILRLGDTLSLLGTTIGQNRSAEELTGFNCIDLAKNGWSKYPVLTRLAQVVPLEMSQQMFLSRCKCLHEVWQRIPNGYIKSLLEFAGCPKSAIKDWGSLKLLQALLNITQRLNLDEERIDAFISNNEPEGWNTRNRVMAPLFLNNELRIADAHESIEKCLHTLEQLGFDIANINSGYGKAFDFVMDSVINAIETIAASIENLQQRK